MRLPLGLTLGTRWYHDLRTGETAEWDVMGIYQNPCRCFSFGLYYQEFPDRTQFDFLISLTGLWGTQSNGNRIDEVDSWTHHERMKKVCHGIIDSDTEFIRVDSMHIPWGIVMMMAMGSIFLASNGAAQNVITDQVAITSEQGKLFGLTSGEGISREFLASGEDVLVIEAKGVTGFVQTSTRLLGFSGRLNRWVDLTLPTGEQIIKWKVTSRMIVVQGRKAAYGFQSDRGRWKRESWGAGESLKTSAVKAHIAVMVTNRRALGFLSVYRWVFPTRPARG